MTDIYKKRYVLKRKYIVSFGKKNHLLNYLLFSIAIASSNKLGINWEILTFSTNENIEKIVFMNEWMNERTNDLMKEWTNEQTNDWLNEWMNEWTWLL